MKFAVLDFTDAASCFAAEEYLMRGPRANAPVWMLWRVNKCAMLGRNQAAGAELDLRAVDELGAQIVRRPSGGGAIYTDLGTVQYSLIAPFDKGADFMRMSREALAAPIVNALKGMGVPAAHGGRNDIYAGGAKVSGTAQYVIGDRICGHGSLLYDTDLAALEKVLRPDAEKVKAKAIRFENAGAQAGVSRLEDANIQTRALRSVNTGVAALRQYFGAGHSVEAFMEALMQSLLSGADCDAAEARGLVFSTADLENIKAIKDGKYANPEWTYGREPRYTYRNAMRFEGGKVEILLDIKKGVIEGCKIFGDFLGVLPAEDLAGRLVSRRYAYDDVSGALESVGVTEYLGGITRGQLLDCIFG